MMETVISKYVEIAGMNNTRDLGGMRTKDGRRIRSGMLSAEIMLVIQI